MAAPETPLTPYASAQHFLGAELRHRRVAAGLSQRAFADRLFVHETLVGKVELGQRYLSLSLAQRCDAELEAGGALVRLHGLAEAERATRAQSTVSAAVTLGEVEAAALLKLIVHAALRDLPPTTASVLARIDSALQPQTAPGRVARAARRLP